MTDIHVAAIDPTRLRESPELAKERERLHDDYGRPLVDEHGLIPIANLTRMSNAQHRELVRQFPLVGPASIARWQNAGLAGLSEWEGNR
jgi:hypothetical protein